MSASRPANAPRTPAAGSARDKLIAAAIATVRYKGFSATSVDEICQAHSVSDRQVIKSLVGSLFGVLVILFGESRRLKMKRPCQRELNLSANPLFCSFRDLQ